MQARGWLSSQVSHHSSGASCWSFCDRGPLDQRAGAEYSPSVRDVGNRSDIGLDLCEQGGDGPLPHLLMGKGDRRQRRCEGLREEVLVIERSEEHTSELQSRGHLVCRLLL